jgi:hypothetical protein
VLETEPKPLRTLRPSLPLELVELAHGCLSKARDQRINSAAKLATKLAAFGPTRGHPGGKETAAPTAPAAAGSMVPQSAVQTPKEPPVAPARATRRWLLFGAPLALAAVAVAVVAAVVSRSSPDSKPATNEPRKAPVPSNQPDEIAVAAPRATTEPRATAAPVSAPTAAPITPKAAAQDSAAQAAVAPPPAVVVPIRGRGGAGSKDQPKAGTDSPAKAWDNGPDLGF